ncbi:MAG TPA: hypothetical protein VNB51_00320 [Candidatus Udaeobacter sp.]|nr:hypothetical protein [Candidatus Udaeobacter sp.]
MSRYHEEQHFHGALMGLLLVAMVFVVVVTVVAVVFSRPGDALLLAIAPVVVVLVASLISLSHLDVDVSDKGVTIAFRYLWPTRRIGFAEIVGLEVRRYNPLLEYGGWGVRLGPRGWGYMTTGNEGVQLRLRKGIPVLIGSARPRELEAAIRAGVEGRSSDER